MKDEKPWSPLGRKMKEFYRKVIILFITIVMSLSNLLMSYSISSAIGLTPTYAVVAQELNYNQIESTAEKRKEHIETVINKHIEELKEQGYINPSWELTFIAEQIGMSMRAEDLSEESIEKAILKNFDFYADYVSLTEKDNTYYFKTIEDSEKFITEVNKYEKTEYEKKESVRKVIGNETAQSDLDNVILSKKIAAEKREAQKKKEAAMRASKTISDTSGIAYDNAIVSYALQFNGNPYVYGGTSLTNGADCSGFVQSIYKHFGVNLPRGARGQASAGYAVSFDSLQPGDLVFYSGDGGASITHVAIYIGGSKIIHAQTPSRGIGVTSANIMVKMTARRVI